MYSFSLLTVLYTFCQPVSVPSIWSIHTEIHWNVYKLKFIYYFWVFLNFPLLMLLEITPYFQPLGFLRNRLLIFELQVCWAACRMLSGTGPRGLNGGTSSQSSMQLRSEWAWQKCTGGAPLWLGQAAGCGGSGSL